MPDAARDISFPETKRKLLDASVRLMLEKGFTATTVDEVCSMAGVTKGSFFHYFESKEQIAEAALDHFCEQQYQAMAGAKFNSIQDPLERLHSFLDFFVQMARNPNVAKSCLLGNFSQELAPTHPNIRCQCEAGFSRWMKGTAGLLGAAKEKYPPKTDFDPESVAALLVTLLQGSLILSKARQETSITISNLEHFRAYLEGLFGKRRAIHTNPA